MRTPKIISMMSSWLESAEADEVLHRDQTFVELAEELGSYSLEMATSDLDHSLGRRAITDALETMDEIGILVCRFMLRFLESGGFYSRVNTTRRRMAKCGE